MGKCKKTMANAIEKEWLPSAAVIFIVAILVGCLYVARWLYS